MLTRPSRYHDYVYVGKGNDGADETGRKYSWNTSHPDLESTQVFYPDKYKNHAHCSYCGEKAYPIQAGLRDGGENYATTGYTCICEAAESEKEYRKRLKELREKQQAELYKLRDEFSEKLQQDKEKQIDIRIKYQRNELEWEKRTACSSADFKSIESSIR